MNTYIEETIYRFNQSRQPLQAERMKAYMRNQFEYLGINSPARTALLSDLWAGWVSNAHHHLPDQIRYLWNLPEREFKYVAMELAYRARKYWPPGIMDLFEYLIGSHSWWDTVDYIAPTLAGTILKPDSHLQEFYTNKWMQEPSFWFHRSAIIFQLKYKSQTNDELLLEMIMQNNRSKEFFIQKAIGWALRQYARVNPVWVKQVVKSVELSRLSYREATRHLL